MKKRKIFGAVLSVLLLVSLLTGCSAGKQENPESSNADPRKGFGIDGFRR